MAFRSLYSLILLCPYFPDLFLLDNLGNGYEESYFYHSACLGSRYNGKVFIVQESQFFGLSLYNKNHWTLILRLCFVFQSRTFLKGFYQVRFERVWSFLMCWVYPCALQGTPFWVRVSLFLWEIGGSSRGFFFIFALFWYCSGFLCWCVGLVSRSWRYFPW